MGYAPAIEAVPAAAKRRTTKRLFTVYVFVTTFVIGEEIYPVFPDADSQLYLRVSKGIYTYYTKTELDRMAGEENLNVRPIGYAMPYQGKVQLYPRDEANAEKIKAYTEMQRWIDSSATRLEAITHPPTPPEMPAVAAPSTPVVAAADLKPYLLALLLIVLFGNVTQIVIAAIK